ncbi:MAG: carboxy-S-adenosyl-L-methionine synthase CmoA [Chloroflexota bacterium]
MHDSIYAQHQTKVAPFQFDEAVADVFPDMIERSIPGYSLTLPLMGLIAERYAQPNSRCYDLGCSLGAVTWAMQARIQQPGCQLVAVDNSSAMLARCRDLLPADAALPPVELVEADIATVPIRNASIVVLHFTLQFLPPEARLPLLQRIFDGLLPGGVLVVSEKVVFADETQQVRFTDLHHDFKRANGYSNLEVSQKRTALENVLIPDTIEQHQARMQAVGFASCDVWFQAFNFASLLAIK